MQALDFIDRQCAARERDFFCARSPTSFPPARGLARPMIHDTHGKQCRELFFLVRISRFRRGARALRNGAAGFAPLDRAVDARVPGFCILRAFWLCWVTARILGTQLRVHRVDIAYKRGSEVADRKRRISNVIQVK